MLVVKFEFRTKLLLFGIQKSAIMVELNTRTMDTSHVPFVPFVHKIMLSHKWWRIGCVVLWNGEEIASLH